MAFCSFLYIFMLMSEVLSVCNNADYFLHRHLSSNYFFFKNVMLFVSSFSPSYFPHVVTTVPSEDSKSRVVRSALEAQWPAWCQLAVTCLEVCFTTHHLKVSSTIAFVAMVFSFTPRLYFLVFIVLYF